MKKRYYSLVLLLSCITISYALDDAGQKSPAGQVAPGVESVAAPAEGDDALVDIDDNDPLAPEDTSEADYDDSEVAQMAQDGILPENSRTQNISSGYKELLQKAGVAVVTTGLMCADYLSACWQRVCSTCRNIKLTGN